MVDQTIELVRIALKNQSCEPESIAEVLLVGGSTAVPLVQQRVVEVFGRENVKRYINPMECVALGAGILAGLLELTDDGVTNAAPVKAYHAQTTPMHLPGLEDVNDLDEYQDADRQHPVVILVDEGNLDRHADVSVLDCQRTLADDWRENLQASIRVARHGAKN